MKKKSRIYWTFALYLIFTCIFLIFFILEIDNFPLFIFLSISSVAVLSTSTIYTISQSVISHKNGIPSQIKLPLKKKSKQQFSSEFLEDYFEAMPIVDQYANSQESYQDISRIDEYIFTEFDQEDLLKIDDLKLSKMDKIFFLREMIYFEPDERKRLIDEMLESQNDCTKPMTYSPPLTPFGIENKLRVYVRSLIEPGAKTKITIIEKSDFIQELK
ncbi:MAG: hypothetical protein EU532_13950, partial [Promethearchaeota archaeon]